MAEDKPSILIVEDDTDVANMLEAYFRIQGYNVVGINGGEAVLESCRLQRPDLIILDIRLPDIDGYEVARRLRGNRRTEDIPIIFLTERRNRSDRLQGFEIGADDYITKPFDIQELRLRVRNALRRSSNGTLTNPVTNLPEGGLLDERLNELGDGAGWVLVPLKLVNLDRFRDAYGFVASDDVVRAVALMIQNAIRDLGNSNDFIGQLNPSQFILVLSADTADQVVRRIRSRLEQSLDYFYPIKDRLPGRLDDERLQIRIKQYMPGEVPVTDSDSVKRYLVI